MSKYTIIENMFGNEVYLINENTKKVEIKADRKTFYEMFNKLVNSLIDENKKFKEQFKWPKKKLVRKKERKT